MLRKRKKGIAARYVDGRAGEDTADNDQIIHVTRRHFDVPAANLYIKEAETRPDEFIFVLRDFGVS